MVSLRRRHDVPEATGSDTLDAARRTRELGALADGATVDVLARVPYLADLQVPVRPEADVVIKTFRETLDASLLHLRTSR